MANTVLVVDDQARPRRALAAELEDAGFRVLEASDGQEAWERFQRERPDLVITDMVMPRSDGVELLGRVRARSETPVLIFTAYGSIESAVAALKGGADEFIVSPDVELDDLVDLVRRALATRASQRNPELEQRLVGRSKAMARVRERIAGIAPLRTPVLVSGESGSGRDTVVCALHDFGSTAGLPFVRVETASFSPRDDIPWEGAIYLDRIEQMRADSQAWWARKLTEIESRPSERAVRIFASSSDSLSARVVRGLFDPQLGRCLPRFEISIPPLRKRTEDIQDISEALVKRIGADVGRPQVRLSAPARALLPTLRWPGNVTQMEETLERAIAYSRGPQIRRRVIQDVLADLEESLASIREQHGDLERQALIAAIRETGGNISRTSEILGKSRSAVYRLIARHGIPLERAD